MKNNLCLLFVYFSMVLCAQSYRHENYDGALLLLKRGTALPAKRAGYFDNTEPVQNRVYRSLKLWSMYADLEESFGTFKVT